MPNSQESTVRQLHSVVPVSPGEQRTRTQPRVVKHQRPSLIPTPWLGYCRRLRQEGCSPCSPRRRT
jgi:hypothetical protein